MQAEPKCGTWFQRTSHGHQHPFPVLPLHELLCQCRPGQADLVKDAANMCVAAVALNVNTSVQGESRT